MAAAAACSSAGSVQYSDEDARVGHIFSSAYTRAFLKNKHIVVVGDSVQRGVYKDIVLLLQQDRLLEPQELKAKCEETFMNDNLVYRSEKLTTTAFSEVREFCSPDGCTIVEFYFVTRCYNERVELMICGFKKEPPDIILMNSCLWDYCKYKDRNDPNSDEKSERAYCENLQKLMQRLRQVLPASCMFIWLSTLPVAETLSGAFMDDDVASMADELRVGVMEKNWYVSQLCVQFGFDLLDLHYYVRTQLKYREEDGIHWKAVLHRHMTDIILTYLHDTQEVNLPASAIDKFNRLVSKEHDSVKMNEENTPEFVERTLAEVAIVADCLDERYPPPPL